MRITVLTSSYPRFPGDGTAPFVQSICEHLACQGHKVEVVAPDDSAVQPMPSAGIKIHRFGYVWPSRWQIMGHARSLNAKGKLRPAAYFLLPFFLLAAFFRTMRVAQRQDAEMIHVHWVLPNGPVAALVAKLRQIPLVISLHGSDMYIARHNWLFGAVAGWTFRQAVTVTACSPEMRDAAITLGASRGQAYLLPWGADPTIFQPKKKVSEQEIVTIAALGRMVLKKGFSVLLEAWAQIAPDFPKARLCIGGDGPLLETLRNEARRLGIDTSIDLPGRILWNQVPQFLAAADIFVLPSIRDREGNIDGLPTVALEAMSCGLPVVASDLGGVPLVIEDGFNGCLVPPGDVGALAKRLRDLLENRRARQKIGQTARASVVDTFNWDNVAHTLSDIFAKAQRPIEQANRKPKADKIRSILEQTLGEDLSTYTCLDVGCGNGAILGHLGESLGFNIGIDIDRALIHRAASTHRSAKTRFSLADGRSLPFPSDHFDIILCTQVYEHIRNPERMAAEIQRVLKPGGVIFFSGPNRLTLIEAHYDLPFLSLLPRWLAHPYLHWFRKIPQYEIYSLFYGQLRRLWNGFEIDDFTPYLIEHPELYAVEKQMEKYAWLGRLPTWLISILKPLYPNYNWILAKPKTIQPEAYTRSYFLTACEGHTEFIASRGKQLSQRLERLLKLASPQPGDHLLDIGCGRGELALHCSQRGAITWGCDYAPEALRLASSMNISPELRLGFQQSDAQVLPLATNSFDTVIMADVVEHLTPRALRNTLNEVWRVLKPTGKLIIHTMPNLWYYRWGYPLFRFFQRLRGIHLPKDPRDRWGFAHLHVNEQTPTKLRKTLKAANFQANVWLESDKRNELKPAVKAGIRTITRIPGLRQILCNNIYAIASPIQKTRATSSQTDPLP